jgi:GNAT superfamily N-acetyltransferase
MAEDLRIAAADAAAAAAVKSVIERAYRGDTARAGWTHEADMITGERITLADLVALAQVPNSRLLVAWSGDTPVGSVAITDKGGGLAYLGLLAIDPKRQAAGLGRRLIAAAEDCAREAFGTRTMEMTVIARRAELIAWYERRGYARSGETRPFPLPQYPQLEMVVLTRELT